ncbi:polysaccharide biosynthesis protein [Heliorestis acidaminivorans]|uniref:Polysaccharide biosynthesis protein n=1 Tax=Heliorestis acidaminivorans TaxID=553427 RepID=A0A6I0F2V2_9FIRM|nr:polysaccharide biosynthesis protein [Heliorestis acidaminivorans]KAB2954311.1 polysaccharide biosynthesis protein [Heliorestis acidaminivorans]
MVTVLTHGALVLFIATVANRILAFLNQIVLMKYIGPETVGLFQMIFPIYILLLVLATAGIPVALTKRVAEEAAQGQWGNVRKYVITALFSTTLIATAVTVIAFFLPSFLFSQVVADVRAETAYLVLLPSILLVALSSVLRSLCQGLQAMEPTAIASFVEQVIRIVSGLSLALLLLPQGLQWAAAGVALGITLGELFGLISLAFFSGPHLFRRLKTFWSHINMPTTTTLRQSFFSLWPLAYPIAISRIITCLMLSVDAYLIPRSLQASGMTLSEATSAFGSFNGGAAPLITIPTVFTIPLSISLIPGIAESWALKQRETVRYRTMKALRITALVSWPVLSILFLVGGDIAELLFDLEGLGPSLSILAIGALFLYFHQTTTSILQGMGKVFFPLLVTVFASVVRALTFLTLASSPQFGLEGVAWAYSFSNIITAFLHFAWLYFYLKISLHQLTSLFRPALGAILMMFIFHFLFTNLLDPLPLLLKLLMATVPSLLVYLISLPFLGSLTRDDLHSLPGLRWFVKKW